MSFKSLPQKFFFSLSQTTKRIWFRSFVYALIGVATALISLFAKGLIPVGLSTTIGAAAVGNILTILASSMLAVSTFSLSIMVTAFGNASSGATPRATMLLMQNQGAQRAVATFIGAFLYSVVGIIALTTNAYGEEGRFLLFLVTIVVILVIVATLIKWVDQLSTLGRVGSTIAEVEKATYESICRYVRKPNLGGRVSHSDPLLAFPASHRVNSAKVGFVTFVDTSALQKICEEKQVDIHLSVLPGSFIYPNRPLAALSRRIDDDCLAEVASTFVIANSRTFEQDPRFGFVLLYEIASRALSPSTNDPGTAIEVIGSATRLLKQRIDLLTERSERKEEPHFSHIYVPDLPAEEFIGTLFGPLARDGASMVEVNVRIQKSLHALKSYSTEYARPCDIFADITDQYSSLALKTPFERTLVAQLKKDLNGENNFA